MADDIKYILLDGEVKVADGVGGWRDPLSDSELAEIRLALPPEMEDRVRRSLLDEAEEDVAMAANAPRPSQMLAQQDKPGSSPMSPLQEQGVDWHERLRLKWLAANPDQAQKFLQGLGYETRPYGSGFNFAVRKGADQPWRLVDPATGFLSKDSAMDFLDITVDGVQGYLTALAQTAGTAVGGMAGKPLLGAMAGGAVGGGLTELGRQEAGVALGVNDEVDAGGVAMSGALSGAVPLVGAAPGALKPYVVKGAEKAAHAALEMSSRITGIAPETMLARARIPGSGKLKSVVDVANYIRGKLAEFTDDLLPEKKAANSIVNEANRQQVTVDMRPYFNRLREYTLGPGPEQAVTKSKIVVQASESEYRKALAESGKSLAESGGVTYKPLASGGRAGVRGYASGREGVGLSEKAVSGTASSQSRSSTTKTVIEATEIPRTTRAARAGIRSGGNVHRVATSLYEDQMQLLAMAKANPAAVPAKLAEAMKQDAQFLATKAKAYRDVALSTPERQVLGELSHGARVIVQRAMDQTGITAANGLKYGQNMAKVDRGMRIIKAAKEVFDPPTAKSEASRKRAATSAVARIWGESGVAHVDVLRDLDGLIGTKLADDALEASVGRAFSKGQFGAQGEIKMLPRLSATGNVLFYGSATAAGAAGGPMAAAPILAAGSPWVNMQGIRAAQAIPGLARNIAASPIAKGTQAALASQPAAAALNAAIQEIAKRKRGPVPQGAETDFY